MDSSSLPGHLQDARSRYRILIRGTLAAGWSARLGGMTITATRLADGAAATALVGVLNALHDFGLPLVSVEHIADETEGL
jgi:hypothetical protein